MRAVIIGGGDFSASQADYIKDGDFVICADSGYDSAIKYNIHADIVIGDMDSVKNSVEGEKIVYPRRKDFTDGELAVRYALENGYDDILLTGFTGERLDHTLSDIFMLHIISENSAKGVLMDDYNRIYYISPKNPVLKINSQSGENMSLVPLCDLSGVYTKGLEYPVENEDIPFFASRTLCNVVSSDDAEIGLSDGRALVIFSKDKNERQNEI